MMPEFADSMSCNRFCERACGWQRVPVLLILALSIVPGMAIAQTDAGDNSGQAAQQQRPNWLITPSVSVEGTYTDNVALAANKKSDFITQISPGISLDGKSGRASASLNYQWQHYEYAQNSNLSNQQKSLAAKGKLELVEQWLFLEGSHNISQQSVSAFGTQSAGNELINANRTETAAYRISPYIQGRFVNAVDYLLRYTGTRTRSDSGALSDSAATTGAWNGRLSGATPLTLLDWSINVDRQTISNANGVDNGSSNVYGTLTYKVDPQFRLYAHGGRETDDYTSLVRQSRTISGIGFDWTPTERTNVTLKKERNAAGNGHNFDFSHRTALTAWKISDSRSLVIPTPQMAQAQTGTAFDLIFRQLASSFPDSTERAAAANQLLAQAGIAADTPIFGALQTSQAYVERRQQASVALMGSSNTVIFAVDRSTSDRLGLGIGLADDFALSPNIRQSGFNASWAHKLTPHAALTFNAGSSRSTGSASLESTSRTWSLLFTTQLGPNTSASVSLRQSRSSGASASDYDEQALTGAMHFKF